MTVEERRGAEDGLGEFDDARLSRREVAGLVVAFMIGIATGGWTPFF